jgi:Domain of unknown function (DUF4780)
MSGGGSIGGKPGSLAKTGSSPFASLAPTSSARPVVAETLRGGAPSQGETTSTVGDEIPFQTVRRKETREERDLRWKKQEVKRREEHPVLYARGYTDEQVRQLLRGPPKAKEPYPPSESFRGKGRGKGASHRGGGLPQGAGRGRGGNPHPGSGGGRGSVLGLTKTPGEDGRKRKALEKTGVTPPAKKGPGTSAGSYTDAAKVGKERTDFPHMLLVHAGKETKQFISEAAFVQIKTKLNKRVLQNARAKERVNLQTAFIQYNMGVGKIACLDAVTSEWYKAAVDVIDIEGASFRAWGHQEAGEIRQARMVATGLEDFEPDEVVELIKAYNTGLNGRISAMKRESYTDKRGSAGSMIVFGIDDSMAESLMGLPTPWTVNLGSDRREIKFSKGGLKTRLGLVIDLAKSMEDVSVSSEETEASKDK